MTRYAIVVAIDTNHEPDAETVCRIIDQEAVLARRGLRRDNLILAHTTLHRVDPTSLRAGTDAPPRARTTETLCVLASLRQRPRPVWDL